VATPLLAVKKLAVITNLLTVDKQSTKEQSKQKLQHLLLWKAQSNFLPLWQFSPGKARNQQQIFDTVAKNSHHHQATFLHLNSI
jgi:hypothetical protein